jgi:hypothetical protein
MKAFELKAGRLAITRRAEHNPKTSSATNSAYPCTIITN